jgi:hypothetical protein
MPGRGAGGSGAAAGRDCAVQHWYVSLPHTLAFKSYICVHRYKTATLYKTSDPLFMLVPNRSLIPFPRVPVHQLPLRLLRDSRRKEDCHKFCGNMQGRQV